MKGDLVQGIVLPEKVTLALEQGILKAKGPKGEAQRKLVHPKIKIILEKNKILLTASKAGKREKTVMGSFFAHINNLIVGVKEPFVYKLKICSGHFPMNVSVSGQELVIKNFLGEIVPRKVQFPSNVQVKVNSGEIEIVSPDKEIAGQVAAKIELACRIVNRDRRVFQDGCYIIEKAGKKI